MIKKSEILLVLNDLKDNLSQWDWEDDYHRSGLLSKEERVGWSVDRINKAIEVIENSEELNN